MLLKPKTLAAQTRVPISPEGLPPLQPTISETECKAKGGLWVGGKCLGLDAAAAAEQARREEIRQTQRVISETQPMISRRTITTERLAPEEREGLYRRTLF
jgi:hypothetical protein